MRVTLSPVVQTFGPGARTAVSADVPVREDAASLAPGSGTAALVTLPDHLAEAATAPSSALTADDDPVLDLEAWLAPLGQTPPAPAGLAPAAATLNLGDGVVDPFGAIWPAISGRPALAVAPADRGALMQQARAALSTAPPQPALRLVIDVAAAGISGVSSNGALQLRFDPRSGESEPIYMALDQETAVALAHRILGWADGDALNDAPGPDDAAC